MAEKPIKTPLPADLPEDWNVDQIVAPDGTAVGLTEQHGYNYLMAAVNRAQTAVNEINNAFETISTGAARLVVGTSTNGWTKADCDYLCDGTDDQAEIQQALSTFAGKGGEVILLPGTYSLSGSISVSSKVWLRGTSKESTTIKRNTASGSGTVNSIISLGQYSKISDFTFENFTSVSDTTYDISSAHPCSIQNIDFANIQRKSIYIESTSDAVVKISECTWLQAEIAICTKLYSGTLIVTDNDIATGTLIQTETAPPQYDGLRVFILRNGYHGSGSEMILDGLSRTGGNIIQGNFIRRLSILNTSGAKLSFAGNVISNNVFFPGVSAGMSAITLGENTGWWFVTGNALFDVGNSANYVVQDLGYNNIVRFNSDDTSGGGSTPATVQQATPTITVNANGTVTAQATQAAGYVAAGTRSATHQLTAADDTDLAPENIKDGVSIFGVTGTLQSGGGVAGVESFNGRSGAVLPQANDYSAADVGAVAASAVKDILAMTQTEYNSLTTKDPTVLYLIKE